jgi:hypothetical protein
MRWAPRGSGAAFLALAFAASSGAVEPAEVAVQVLGGPDGSEIVIEAGTPSGDSVSITLEPGTAREAMLELPGPSPWVMKARAEGFWSEPVAVDTGSGAIRLELWPATTLGFRLEAAVPGLALPPEVEVRLQRPASGEAARAQPGETELRCPVDEKGATSCGAPAGTWDVRVKAVGFVPHHLWNRPCAAGELASLGRLVLRQGAAILGQVSTETGFADPRQAHVVIEPVAQPEGGSPIGGVPKELARLGASLSINEWGFFQSDALPPGAYRVTAKQPQFADASVVVDLQPDGDTELSELLVLRRPLRLSVLVEPPGGTGGARWRTEVLGLRQGDLQIVTRGVVDATGLWVTRPLPPGRYTLRVHDGAGSAYAWEEGVLGPGAEEVLVALDVVRVEGEVRIGNEPLAASLWFGGRSGRVHVEAEADQEGRFQATLPRSGSWAVDVRGRTRPVEAGRIAVDVPRPRGGRPARVTIELPDTAVRGYVRDTTGQPVEGASIRLLGLDRPEGTVAARSDERGEFEIQGHPTGSYSVEAADATRSSDRVHLILAAGSTAPEVELVLRERRELRGTVIARHGPVAGAFVLGFPFAGDGTLAAMELPDAHTALDGTFSIELPQATARVRLVVTSPGHTLAAVTLAVAAGDTSALVVLPEERGRLEVAGWRGGSEGKLPLLMMGGEALDLPLLANWAEANGGSTQGAVLAVEAMPPGPYAYCALAPEEAFLVFTGVAAPAPGACSEGFLTAGGTLALAPPGPP